MSQTIKDEKFIKSKINALSNNHIDYLERIIINYRMEGFGYDENDDEDHVSIDVIKSIKFRSNGAIFKQAISIVFLRLTSYSKYGHIEFATFGIGFQLC